jgi:hypothetical protein
VSEQNRLLRSQQVSPEDDFAYGQGISPEATWRNLIPFAEFGLGMAPVSGEAMAARDAWDASGRGGNALLQGQYGDAASEYLNMGTGILGAIPGAGIIARGTKRGAAWMDRKLPEGFNRLLDSVYPSDPRSTTFSGAGPTAKATSSGDIYGTISKNNQVGDYRLIGPSSDDTYEIIRSDGKRVGDINIGQMDDGSVYLGPRIDPEFQKQGIASEIYKHVQGLADQSGLKLKKSNLQTPAGDALWRSLERR